MIRRLAPAIFLAVLIGILISLTVGSGAMGALGAADFLPYWCATYLLTHGHDPYDPDGLNGVYQMIAPEAYRSVDPAYRAPWALGPPWAMLLIAPLGLLPFQAAVQLWLVLCTIVMCGLSLFLWRWLGGSATAGGQLLALVIGLGFAQTLAALALGQIVVLVLLGLVLSLALLDVKRDRWAGITFAMALIKPQAVFLLGPALLLWTLRQRRWQMWAALACTLVLATLLLALIAPGALASYLKLLRTYDYFRHSAATLGGVMQVYLNTNLFRWIGLATLLFVPWLADLMTRRGVFTGANTALLISMPLAPYGWGYDQALLLPALLQIAVWAVNAGRRSRNLLLGALAAIYMVLWLARFASVGDFLYLWVPVAIGVLYATAVRLLNPVNKRDAQAAVP
jgi:hypothetical protein